MPSNRSKKQESTSTSDVQWTELPNPVQTGVVHTDRQKRKREYDKGYYSRNRKRYRAQQKEYYQRNHEQKKEYYQRNHEKIAVQQKEYSQRTRQQALCIISSHPSCAWSHLGGCDGDLEIDHIRPVLRRTRSGYASHGIQLIRWICNNPNHPKLKGLQLLCNEHNRFKNTRNNSEAMELWKAEFCPKPPKDE